VCYCVLPCAPVCSRVLVSFVCMDSDEFTLTPHPPSLDGKYQALPHPTPFALACLLCERFVDPFASAAHIQIRSDPGATHADGGGGSSNAGAGAGAGAVGSGAGRESGATTKAGWFSSLLCCAHRGPPAYTLPDAEDEATVEDLQMLQYGHRYTVLV
jgi:hypothetical protein